MKKKIFLFLFLLCQFCCQGQETDCDEEDGLNLCPWPCLDPCYSYAFGQMAHDEACHYDSETNICTQFRYHICSDESCCETSEEILEEFQLFKIHDGKLVYWVKY